MNYVSLYVLDNGQNGPGLLLVLMSHLDYRLIFEVDVNALALGSSSNQQFDLLYQEIGL
jgi:hypothetical protein